MQGSIICGTGEDPGGK